MDPTEKQLCESIRMGSKEAFETVFKTYYRFLCTYANGFLMDLNASEEVVQEMFFQLWVKRENLLINSTLKAYLFRAVHNSCLNLIKHQKVKSAYESYVLQSKEADFQDSFLSVEFSEMQARLDEAIRMLPPERKKIFLMIRIEERKYKEVADILGISVKTVENQMGKAMQHLRQALQDYLPIIFFIMMAIWSIFSTSIGVTANWIVII